MIDDPRSLPFTVLFHSSPLMYFKWNVRRGMVSRTTPLLLCMSKRWCQNQHFLLFQRYRFLRAPNLVAFSKLPLVTLLWLHCNILSSKYYLIDENEHSLIKNGWIIFARLIKVQEKLCDIFIGLRPVWKMVKRYDPSPSCKRLFKYWKQFLNYWKRLRKLI